MPRLSVSKNGISVTNLSTFKLSYSTIMVFDISSLPNRTITL